MVNNKEVILTYEGLVKLEKELEEYKSVKRKEVSERIKQALAFGDISENSEYDEAKNEQAFIEGRIATIENMLKKAKVIDEEDITTDVVNIGSKVTVRDLEDDEEVEYTIVGSAEADPIELKISNESPVGRAIIGNKIGSVVEISVPDGVLKYEILNISK
jgi:transcription elongation factor GreA